MDPAEKFDLEAQQSVKPIEAATARGDSRIQHFYHDCTLLLTGGSGFIGKQLLEKLFRSCNVKKAFVIIRPKKGKCIQERLKEMLADPVFQRVREKKPDFDQKIIAVEGDVAKLRLGLRDEDWNTLAEEVNFIFHVAATTRFDEKIQLATFINVRGTREVIALAKTCDKLKCFVHVSTIFSHATRVRTEVLEDFYPVPIPPDTLIKMAETLETEILDRATPSLIEGWPNTYSFTKAVAESLVQAESWNLTTCVVRPAVVIHAYREPLPGWLDLSCMFGASGLVLGPGVGVIRVVSIKTKKKIELVPVDYVNNATIAAAWDAATRRDNGPIIYNISNSDGPTFENVANVLRTQKIRSIITPKAVWYSFAIIADGKFISWIMRWLLHYIPAYAVDAIMALFKIKKPAGLKSFIHIYVKFDKLLSALSYFLTTDWKFDQNNLHRLKQKMSDVDRVIYNFDTSDIDIKHLIFLWALGTRKYIVKDGLKGTRVAQKRQFWFKMASYFILICFLCLCLKVFTFTLSIFTKILL